METLRLTPASLDPSASARLLAFADFDSGWIAVTSHEGFRLELAHALDGKPSQVYVMFSPDFEESYSMLNADGPIDRTRVVGLDTNAKRICLWTDTGDALRCPSDHQDSTKRRWDFGFLRVLAMGSGRAVSGDRRFNLTERAS